MTETEAQERDRELAHHRARLVVEHQELEASSAETWRRTLAALIHQVGTRPACRLIAQITGVRIHPSTAHAIASQYKTQEEEGE